MTYPQPEEKIGTMSEKTMSPEAQRIAIAEACGLHSFGYMVDVLTGEDELTHLGEGMAPCLVPDYLNDLNAIHEAEKAMSPEQRRIYSVALGDVVNPSSVHKGLDGFRDVSFQVHHATAAQRSEAFLRTIGKWNP